AGNTQALGQAREGFNTWLEFYGSSEKGSGNASVFSDYKASRWGMILGGDVQIYSRCVAGVFFGYGNPHISNDLGKVSAQDISFGVYVGTPLPGGVNSNVMLGYGDQSYTYSGIGNGKTDFSGSSVYASWEVSRRCGLSVFELTPLAALDFQTTSMDGFTITSINQTLAPKGMDYAALRLGVNGKWKRLHTRLQYAHQLAGDDFAETRVAFIGGTSSTTLRSVQWGKDWFNAGFGGELWGSSVHWKFLADYDFEANNNTTAHTGSLKAVFAW
ncbi:MAG: autotransporter outer membrane beta-barrel domain-containing protein, partial [Planctomycetaceae bacterium]|nr:autotransporter outer membrane beta-barrel domain-containing protein [Planctomycetaceae bacterium]